MSGSDTATILMIEDEPEVLEMYQFYLGEEYNVRQALGGEEGLEKLDETVDVVLLDRRMPGLSGSEVLEEIRARGVDCRVIMVTAVDPDLDLLNMEFDEYLVKPVSEGTLKQAIERMLQRDALDEHIEEIFALAAKLATLQSKLDIEQLERSEEYHQLLEELEALRKETEFPINDEYYSEATLDTLQSLLAEAGQ